MARIKRKSSLGVLVGSVFVLLMYHSLRLGTATSATSKRVVRERHPSQSIEGKLLTKRGSSLKSFYEELATLGYRKGDGGSVLFRKVLREPIINDPVFLRVYVASAPAHSVRRDAIRETWGSQGRHDNISIVFMIGKSELDEDVQREANIHGDILQGDYRDSYDNLVFKSISMLSHFSFNYPHPEYILKTDDDIFVNVPKLVKYLSSVRPLGIIGCDKSQELQPFGPMGESLPPSMAIASFVVGAGYVLHRDTALSLPSGCLRSDPIPVEDVYVTSRCARAAVPPVMAPTHHGGFSCGRWIQRPCELAYSFTGHHVNSQRMRTIMKVLLAGGCTRSENEYPAY